MKFPIWIAPLFLVGCVSSTDPPIKTSLKPTPCPIADRDIRFVRTLVLSRNPVLQEHTIPSGDGLDIFLSTFNKAEPPTDVKAEQVHYFYSPVSKGGVLYAATSNCMTHYFFLTKSHFDQMKKGEVPVATTNAPKNSKSAVNSITESRPFCSQCELPPTDRSALRGVVFKPSEKWDRTGAPYVQPGSGYKQTNATRTVMIEPDQLRENVIKPTLKSIGLYSPAAEDLLLATAIMESGLVYLRQHNNGPARGIYQIEPATRADCHANFLEYRDKLDVDIHRLLTSEHPDDQLITNLSYATAIARIIYFRAPTPLPEHGDLEGYAKYWKKHYNTPLGAGTVDDFIDKTGDFI